MERTALRKLSSIGSLDSLSRRCGAYQLPERDQGGGYGPDRSDGSDTQAWRPRLDSNQRPTA
jgi:hypothetical protein